MSSVNEWIVREYLESLGFLVRQPTTRMSSWPRCRRFLTLWRPAFMQPKMLSSSQAIRLQ